MHMIIDKEAIQQAIKQVLGNRSLTSLMFFMALIGVIYSVTVALNIHSSDVTAYSRYTAFGEAHFYKNHWQYLISFVAFGPLVVIAHASLMVKLYAIERRQTALLVGWIGIAIVIIAFVYTMAILGLGSAT